jgi:hypothetical protein
VWGVHSLVREALHGVDSRLVLEGKRLDELSTVRLYQAIAMIWQSCGWIEGKLHAMHDMQVV